MKKETIILAIISCLYSSCMQEDSAIQIPLDVFVGGKTVFLGQSLDSVKSARNTQEHPRNGDYMGVVMRDERQIVGGREVHITYDFEGWWNMELSRVALRYYCASSRVHDSIVYFMYKVLSQKLGEPSHTLKRVDEKLETYVVVWGNKGMHVALFFVPSKLEENNTEMTQDRTSIRVIFNRKEWLTSSDSKYYSRVNISIDSLLKR